LQTNVQDIKEFEELSKKIKRKISCFLFLYILFLSVVTLSLLAVIILAIVDYINHSGNFDDGVIITEKIIGENNNKIISSNNNFDITFESKNMKEENKMKEEEKKDNDDKKDNESTFDKSDHDSIHEAQLILGFISVCFGDFPLILILIYFLNNQLSDSNSESRSPETRASHSSPPFTFSPFFNPQVLRVYYF
jgi:hypothetical protein